MNFLLVFVIPGLILLLIYLMSQSGDKKPIVSPPAASKPKQDMKRIALIVVPIIITVLIVECGESIGYDE